MKNIKQTAVEFFDTELQKTMIIEYGETRSILIPFEDYIRIKQVAKDKERQQHGNTWDAALDAGQDRAWNVMRAYEDFDDYYNK